MDLKKSVFILGFILTVFSSYAQQKATNLDKAKRLIKKELFSTLNDFGSYQPVSYSKVVKTYTKASEDEDIKEVVQDMEIYKAKIGDFGNYLKLTEMSRTDTVISDVNKLFKDATNRKLDELATKYAQIGVELYGFKLSQYRLFQLLKDFKPEFVGMEVEHKYRAKNSNGAYMIQSKKFIFDKNISEIIKIIDLD